MSDIESMSDRQFFRYLVQTANGFENGSTHSKCGLDMLEAASRLKAMRKQVDALQAKIHEFTLLEEEA